MDPLSTEVLEGLNPGIRRTVVFLREKGFDTCDSGDGVTHEFECDAGIAYVNIEVRPEFMVAESHRLVWVLRAAGIETVQTNADGTSKSVESSYDPYSEWGWISLINVTDADLKRSP